jgi:hypothetical protein
VNYLTEVINLASLGSTITTPSPRDFVFDFDFNGNNFIRTDIMAPAFVKFGTSTAESRNGLATANINTPLLGNTTSANTNHSVSTSSTGATYGSTLVTYFFTFDRVNNKILLSIAAMGTPAVPTWSCMTFRAWTTL